MDPSNQTSCLSGARRSLRIASRSDISHADFSGHSIQLALDASQGELGRSMYNRLIIPHVLCSTCQNLVDRSNILRSTPRETMERDCELFLHLSMLEIGSSASSKSCHLCTLIWGALQEKESKTGNFSNNRLRRRRLTIEIRTTLPPAEMNNDWHGFLRPYFPMRVFRGRHMKKGQRNPKDGTWVASLSVTVNQRLLKNAHGGPPGWPFTPVDQDIPAQFAVYTNSDSTFELAKCWLNQCLADHELCRELRTREQRLPTRLIEIGMRQNQIIASLRRSEELAQDVVYMALSHCWGTIPALKLTAKSCGALYSGLYIGVLPKTFRDAIIISYRLGFYYLWIDSLCIFQDSQEDWARESVRMADVYQNTVCTIVATAAENSHSGCFVERNSLSSFPCRITGDKEEGLYIHKLDLDAERGWGKVPRQKPVLETRGWALQERLLSPRIIKYGTRMISWECRQMEASEEWPYGVQPHRLGSAGVKNAFTTLTLKQGGLSEVDKFCRAWEIVRNSYMSCSLTKPDDRLVAMSGMVQAIQLCNNFNNVAGLWREDLVMELLWSANLSSMPKPAVYIAPSWSWASINGSLGDHLYTRNGFKKEWRAKVIDVQVTHSNPGAFGTGQISSGTLTIRGIVQQLRWRKSWNDVPSPHILCNLDGTECRLNDSWWPDEPVSPSLKIWGFPMVNWTAHAGILGSMMKPHNIDVGLVIVPVKGEGGNVWRRIGIFERLYEPAVYRSLSREEQCISII